MIISTEWGYVVWAEEVLCDSFWVKFSICCGCSSNLPQGTGLVVSIARDRFWDNTKLVMLPMGPRYWLLDISWSCQRVVCRYYRGNSRSSIYWGGAHYRKVVTIRGLLECRPAAIVDMAWKSVVSFLNSNRDTFLEEKKMLSNDSLHRT